MGSSGGPVTSERLVIDGAHGEGGGQIVRTVLALSAVTGRAVRIENIRAGRPNPGLAAQHLTGVRAVAALCGAKVEGDALGSKTLAFTPSRAPEPGAYRFDVAEARAGGSAGAAPLVLQAVLPPLATARSGSSVTVRGGTHVAKSPCFDYLDEVWRPALAAMGIEASLTLRVSGWFPVGQGCIEARIEGRGAGGARLGSYRAETPGDLREVRGRALAANLPAHIPQRMADRARSLLEGAGIPSRIEARRLNAACPGAAIFLLADYERSRAGFTAWGRRGKPAETVAEEAVAALIAQRRSGAALDAHLGDQILLPAALAEGRSRFTVERVSTHLRTNAWVIERFGLARVTVEGAGLFAKGDAP
jgi:RNA 3'-terminal phosphate cyclase (ATP)